MRIRTGRVNSDPHEADSGLDLARGERLLAVVPGQAERLGSHAVEGVVNERVHDRLG